MAERQRATALDRLAREQFDLVVVGGGITGAGVALDAAARGLRTALVERGDLASGTSSRSSKLVHGGLRYLQQREYRLVRENLAERQRLLRNAPHLVRPIPFLIPLLGRRGLVDQAVATGYATALWAYDLAGGLRIGHRHRRVDARAVLAHLPGLRPDVVASGFVYHDARADDARLTLAVARSAVDHGATVVTYAPVTAITKGAYGRAVGLVLADGTEVTAATLVNATGVWSDRLRLLDDDPTPPALRPAKGVHVTVARDRFPCDMAAVLPAGGGRSIFVVPWGERVYLGTTDTDYDGPLDDPQATPADVAYLLAAVNAVAANPLGPDDVLGTWAGLRPLVARASSAATADLSRRHRVTVSPSGLITVTGGKLTTYRRMAADTVDRVVAHLGRGPSRSPTRGLALHGAAGTASLRVGGAAARLGVSAEV
ncbi:MAG: FAD-dependent oxidoreductase, partial [Acidimicrobiales bacterium]